MAVTWGEELTAYDFGPRHAMAPIRLELTMALAQALGVLNRANVSVLPVECASDKELGLVHTEAYVAAVRRASATHGSVAEPDFGLGTVDNPLFPGMHDAAARIAGATLGAAQAVWHGDADHGVSIAGGMHHAMAAAASGFCIYNDIAIAISWLLAQGARRIVYVDLDVHHGDGVQAAFWADPRVTTISIHESGRALFPGTGYAEESGAPGAEGSAVNVPLPAGTEDDGWLRAFFAVVPPLIRRLAPDVLVTQQGCDGHALDPLAHLELSVDGMRIAYAALHELAHEVCGGRWVATGGGGYAVLRVVPRAWTQLLAEASGAMIDPYAELPASWRRFGEGRTGRLAPTSMGDGRPISYEPWRMLPAGGEDGVDRSIRLARLATFPRLGLDPLLP